MNTMIKTLTNLTFLGVAAFTAHRRRWVQQVGVQLSQTLSTQMTQQLKQTIHREWSQFVSGNGQHHLFAQTLSALSQSEAVVFLLPDETGSHYWRGQMCRLQDRDHYLILDPIHGNVDFALSDVVAVDLVLEGVADPVLVATIMLSKQPGGADVLS